MAKKLKDMTKIELLKATERFEQKAKKEAEKAKSLQKKVDELEEVNKLLAMQQDDEETTDATKPITAPKKKKLADMGEYELAEHMRLKTSRKEL